MSSGLIPSRSLFFPAAREEFVFAKLRREEQEEGLYIIRWSVLDFNRMILSVVKRGQQQVNAIPATAFLGTVSSGRCWFR